MLKDLAWIKKHYGEQMMRLCRELFPVLLEKEGELSHLLDERFAYNRHLAEDILNENQKDSFAKYIISLRNEMSEGEMAQASKTAQELMKKAGYTLYPECQTVEEIQAFKKYYAKGEELCTFRGDRLYSCRVWFAIKDNVDDIKRSDFKHPKRQDEYGTSVISIQFAKNRIQTLSIKNRYNHTVPNPDNTFANNLDNIIPGLTDAFEKDFGARCIYDNDSKFELHHYTMAGDKMYPVNYEIDNVCYCENNKIIDNEVVKQLPSHQLLLDYFIVDFKEKTIKKYISDKTHAQIDDCFLDSIGEIKNIIKDKNIIKITVKDGKDIEIGIDERNRIVSLKNHNMQKCGNGFLRYNKVLGSFDAPNLQVIGDCFCYENKELKDLNLHNCITCGDGFLSSNMQLKNVDMPKLEECGNSFLFRNVIINNAILPKLKKCGALFLNQSKIENINLPNLEVCAAGFMQYNPKVRCVHMPKLTNAGSYFLSSARSLEEIDLPSLIKCGDEFLCNNKCIEYVNFPSLECAGGSFLWHNEKLKSASFPKLKEVGAAFLSWNDIIETLEIPNLKKTAIGFLRKNQSLKELKISPDIESSHELRHVKEVVERNRKNLGLSPILWQSEIENSTDNFQKANANNMTANNKGGRFINFISNKFKQIVKKKDDPNGDFFDSLDM